MKRQSRADFLYEIATMDGQQVIFIWDLDKGKMSVTNDIEHVVADIAEMETVNPCECKIFYRDSDGHWTGWDSNTHRFQHFRFVENYQRFIAFAEILFEHAKAIQ